MSIGKSSFYQCGLINIVFPEGVTAIDEQAFRFCDNLSEVVIPHSLTEIEEYAVDGCISISNITYNGTEEEWDEIYIASNNTPLQNPIIKYAPDCTARTETIYTTSSNRTTFTCTPRYLPIGSRILLACYKDGVPVDIQSVPNENKTIYFIVNEDFDSAKVIALDSLKTFRPVCTAELVK